MVPISSGSYSGERKSMMFDSFLIKNSLTPTFCVSDRGRLKMQALLKNTLRNVSVSFSLACTYAGGEGRLFVPSLEASPHCFSNRCFLLTPCNVHFGPLLKVH